MKLNLKVLPKFPSDVIGSAFISIVKTLGKFTISADYLNINPVIVNNPTIQKFVVQDSTDGSFGLVSLADVVASGTNPSEVTLDGDFNVSPSDTYLRIHKTTPAPTNINLPAAADRNGLGIGAKDTAGNAQAYNFALIPNGIEDIDGYTAADGGYKGTMNFQFIQLIPRAGGWDVVHSG